MPTHITSKWKKTKAIAVNSSIREHIPITKRMTKESLKSMLEEYNMVYIKPDKGTFGNGVMRVERKGHTDHEGAGYQYQAGEKLKKFKGFEAMYKSICKHKRKRKYLVQKGINLLKYKGNRFDLRVMVQQSPKRKWETTGVIGRVAHPKKIVTNFHSGGTLKPVGVLLNNYLSNNRKVPYIGKLKSLGLDVAKTMHAHYRGVKEIGLDVALDKELKPWILEVNTRPDPFIFRRLKNKRIFAKIVRYARAYKRL
ncbi:Endospore coat-associated protein YheD [compost metagenome]